MAELSVVSVGATFRHFKGGEYRVLAVARHSETGEPMVVYEGESGVWVRPLAMFTDEVERDGRKTLRFALVEPARTARP